MLMPPLPQVGLYGVYSKVASFSNTVSATVASVGGARLCGLEQEARWTFQVYPLAQIYQRNCFTFSWIGCFHQQIKEQIHYSSSFRTTQANSDYRLLWTSGDISTRPSKRIFHVHTPRIALPNHVFCHYWHSPLASQGPRQLHKFFQQFSAALPHNCHTDQHSTAIKIKWGSEKRGLSAEGTICTTKSKVKGPALELLFHDFLFSHKKDPDLHTAGALR